MICRDVMNHMEVLAPSRLMLDWDYSGLAAGDPGQEVMGVLVCLDVLPETLEEARRVGADMIVCHHPPIFRKMRTFSEETPEGRLLSGAIRSRICVFSAHTNYDLAPGGLTELLAERLGLMQVESWGVLPDGRNQLGRVGILAEPLDEAGFARYVCNRLGTDHVRLVGSARGLIHRVAVQNGAFDREFLADAVRSGADALVTGDVKYHDAQDLACSGLLTVDAGHYPTECLFSEAVAEVLRASFPNLPVHVAHQRDVFRVATRTGSDVP